MPDDPRLHVADSIESAIAELSAALGELDRIPLYDRAIVGWVAHAMNNCLSVSDATLGLIEDAVRGQENPQIGRWLAGLRHLGGLMHHTLGMLLRASSPAEFALKPDYISVPLLMQRACDYHRTRAAQKQLQFVCRTVGDVPLAWADPVALAIVADNLLTNAVKVSTSGGEVVVQILAGPGGVVCSVRDRGPGLSRRELSRLLRANPKMGLVQSAGETSGDVGLAIAKEFIDRMNGKLWVESDRGEGTCFSFRLPYHAASSSDPPRLPPAPDKG